MTEFLSAAWLADKTAERARPDPADVRLVIQQRVTGGATGEVTYVVRVTDDGVAVEPGVADNPDVTVSQDWATANAIHDGTLSAAEAMASGRIRVGGAVTRLLAEASALERVNG